MIGLRSNSIMPLGLLMCLAPMAMACNNDDPETLRWRLEVDEALLDQAASIEVRILRSHCQSQTVLYSQSIQANAIFVDKPPVLQKGSYGFSARLLDQDCQRIAEGCLERNLPASGTVIVPIKAAEAALVCAPSMCNNGLCEQPLPPNVGSGDSGVAADSSPGADASDATPLVDAQ